MKGQGCSKPVKKPYPCAVATDKPMAKIFFVSFLIALWVAIFYWDLGWVMTLIVIMPLTFLVGMGVAVLLEAVLEPMVRWFKK